MGVIADALAWRGSSATLSMFVVSESRSLLETTSMQLEPAPSRTRTYVLDNEEGVLSGRHVVEYDLQFAEVPPNLDELLARCLRAARSSGADVAWFGFEGSFDYHHLLSADVANQVYAVADSEGVAIASDSTLSSAEWVKRVVRAGKRIRARE